MTEVTTDKNAADAALTDKIIACLQRDGRASYSTIARELHTTRDYVASRINPLLGSGELRVIAVPHPRALGPSVSAHLHLNTKGPVRPTLRALLRLASVTFISTTVGAHQIVVEMTSDNLTALQEQVRLIRTLRGVITVQVLLHEHLLYSSLLGPDPKSPIYIPDHHDMSIVRRLRENGRASYADLSRHAGLSMSGARLRLQRMLEEGVIKVSAIRSRANRTRELLLGVGICGSGDLRDAVQVLRAQTGLEFLARTVGHFDLIANLNFDALADLREMTMALTSLPAISYCEQWFHGQIVADQLTRRSDIGPRPT